jgi:hypothetical protein
LRPGHEIFTLKDAEVVDVSSPSSHLSLWQRSRRELATGAAIRVCAAILIAGLQIAAAVLATPGFAAADSLLLNGDFSAGSGDTPDGWHRESWIDLPTTRLIWIKPSGGEPGIVSVENGADNMAHWVQRVHLNPGWYYVSAQVETLGLGTDPSKTGAMISLTGLGVPAENLTGSNPWTTGSFYLKVGAGGADVPIALGIGFSSGYDTGQALFRGASVVPVDEPAPGPEVIDLDKVNDHFGQGSQWPLAILLCPLIAAAAAGWIFMRPPAPVRA